MEKRKEKKLGKKKAWFRILKTLTKIRYKKPEFHYLGEEITNGALIVSNHEGTDAPMSLEIYSGKPLKFWGAHQMNSGLKKMYSYQTKVYFHEKKHWNLFAARMFCLLASPLTNLFYKGLDVISTYQDGRLKNTLKETMQSLEEGYNVVVFPEKSDNGYEETLKGFHEGTVYFAEFALKKGKDLPIFVTYFNKKNKVYIIDKPVYYSALKEKCGDKKAVSDYLCNRCNELGEQTYAIKPLTKKKRQ